MSERRWSSFTPADRASTTLSAMLGSSRSSRCSSDQRSSNATDEADLVEHLDQRRQPGLDRVHGQDALRERVQGADRGGVEILQSRGRSLPAVVAGAGSRQFRFSKFARNRSRSSAPAFSVKVTAAMSASGSRRRAPGW